MQIMKTLGSNKKCLQCALKLWMPSSRTCLNFMLVSIRFAPKIYIKIGSLLGAKLLGPWCLFNHSIVTMHKPVNHFARPIFCSVDCTYVFLHSTVQYLIFTDQPKKINVFLELNFFLICSTYFVIKIAMGIVWNSYETV